MNVATSKSRKAGKKDEPTTTSTIADMHNDQHSNKEVSDLWLPTIQLIYYKFINFFV